MKSQDDRLEPYKAMYGLDYQVDFLRTIDQVCSLAGKRVLEIGGSNLPRKLLFDGLNAQQWICVDDITTFNPHNHRDENDLLYEHYRQTKIFHHSDSVEDILKAEHAIIDGDASDLNINEYFDVIISIAAFEHIHRFSTMLNKLHAALKIKGELVSFFQPIWSSIHGHHLVGITDAQGNKYGMGGLSIVPQWGHLLYTPPQLYKILSSITDKKCADEIIYSVYNSTMINRLFYDDYVDYMNASEFRLKTVIPMGQCEIPDQISERLIALYPSRSCFDANTILIHAAK